MVADQPAREADPDRREGRQQRTLRHVPDGRGRSTATDVCRHSVVDHSAARVARTGLTGGVIVRQWQVAIGEVCAGVPKPALCSPPVPSLDGFERAFARGERELPLLKAFKGAIIVAKPLESDVCRLMRTSHSNAGRPNDRQDQMAIRGLLGGTLFMTVGAIVPAGAQNSTVVVAPTGATSGSGPRQDAAGTLLLSVHDRSWLSSYRAKSAGSVSRSESRTTKQLKSKI